MKRHAPLVALAGQPNCGKSTVFNALTGANQHIANYPGVTVEKRSGSVSCDGTRATLVDLPGTYGITSFSLEEQVACDFLVTYRPDLVVNVLDASNLKRSLLLTLQLMELGVPLLIDANMMDAADKRGVRLDPEALGACLGLEVVPTAIKNSTGKQTLEGAMAEGMRCHAPCADTRIVDYGELEPAVTELSEKVMEIAPETRGKGRWVALKLLSGDHRASDTPEAPLTPFASLFSLADGYRLAFRTATGIKASRHIAEQRQAKATEIAGACLCPRTSPTRPLSDRVDAVVCHRIFGPILLVTVAWLLYQLAIVQGYRLTGLTWPLLLKGKSLLTTLLPDAGFLHDPMARALGLWVADSILALLNYIPIFLILFALIAILEDSGYMPRMAFILDKIFHRYGLHGQSTLPMVLGGVYAGGCAVPAIMSTRGIPDDRARMATILIIPMLNCLAKIPLYILLINAYFPHHKGAALFFISTVTLFMVLPVSKLLTTTALARRPEAPFIMEMPAYHLPRLRSVLQNAVSKVWLFVKKIVTVVAAVAVIVFVLIQFPGINEERTAHFDRRAHEIKTAFLTGIEGNPLARGMTDKRTEVLVRYADHYKAARFGASTPAAREKIDERFTALSPDFFAMVSPGKSPDGRRIRRELKKLIRSRKKLKHSMQQEVMEASFIGMAGKALVPVTRHAGFSWRINIALLSALMAKENSVATLGALYRQDSGSQSVAAGMKDRETGFTPLHALALMIFMALYPPCLPAAMMVKLQTGSFAWMGFSIAFPAFLGITIASGLFTLGSALDLTGLEAMALFYILAVLLTVTTGFIPSRLKSAPQI
ncbi:ferrous iron transport protein B [Desulfoluna spongiiphila]|uniref:ferrous iron transport protein B n=1 Tax=Desulfoluna spongiiphila TaxID=419481 RepID=UPI001256B6F6|nr:ferrous iron transport protein B [Desulfoluna spongiiphila]VVS94529.1 ferrous iron transport protein b [Desulfoluna spongiiphila]